MDGFCIFCGEKILFNLNNPVCAKCGGMCSVRTRSSPTIGYPMFCHRCGETSYISQDNPLCEQCFSELKNKNS